MVTEYGHNMEWRNNEESKNGMENNRHGNKEPESGRDEHGKTIWRTGFNAIYCQYETNWKFSGMVQYSNKNCKVAR